MVDNAVDHGGGNGLVGEDFAPAGKGQVAGQDDRAGLVARGDQLEEQVRCVGVEGEIANLVDDQELQPGDSCAVRFGVGPSGERFAGG